MGTIDGGLLSDFLSVYEQRASNITRSGRGLNVRSSALKDWGWPCPHSYHYRKR